MTLKLKNSGVFVMESVWSNKINKPFPSVDTVFNVIKSNTPYFDYTVLNCNTREELIHSLDLAKSNSKQFRVLYFASHGHPYGIELSHSTGDTISLNELGDILGDRFNLWAIHFGSCSVLDVKDKLIWDFMDKTKVKMLTGYGIDVDWMESASFELLFFSYLTQYYENLDSFKELWYNRYSELSSTNSFKWFLKGKL